MKRLLFSVTSVVIVAAVLAGCGGGGGGQPGVTLTIGGDTSPQSSRADTRAATLIAPVDPGAVVTVYDFKTGSVIKTGTIDATGFCRLDITPGLTVAVVITGTRSGKSYRLSRIIPVVPVGDTEYVVGPATTLAAEAIGEKHYRTGAAIDEGTVDVVTGLAETYVQAHTSADFSVGGGLIAGTTFGAAGSLNATALQSIIDAVPNTIDNNLVAGKNAVQQIKEAGLPLEAILSQELPDANSIFTTEVAAKYEALAARLGKLILPSILGDLQYNASEASVFGLTVGQAYKVSEKVDGILVIADDPAHNQAGKITIIYTTIPGETPAGTYKVEAVKSGSQWTVTQTFTGDPQQLYTVTVPEVPETGPGANPTLTINASLKDSDFSTPLTFSGTVRAAGTDPEHYTSITLSGTLSTPQLSSSGTFQANFPASLPAGADPSSSTYGFPTAFSMSNASITGTSGGTTIRLTGSVSVTTALITAGGGPEVLPKHIESSITYSNSHTGLSFSGSITGDWSNPASGVDETTAKGSLHVNGQLSREDHPTYSVDMRVTLDSGTATCQIDLRAGSATLQGTGSLALTATGLGSADLTLTNQNGVQFTIARDALGNITGSVKVGTTKVADITKEGDLLKITYTDHTFDAFPL